MVLIKDNAGRPLYYMKHGGKYMDLKGNEISKNEADKIVFSGYKADFPKFSFYSFCIGFCVACLLIGILKSITE